MSDAKTLSPEPLIPLESPSAAPSEVAAWLGAKLRRYGILLFLLGLWELSGRAHWVDQTVVPSLTLTLKAIAQMWQRIDLGSHILISLGRVIFGLLIGLSVGAPMAYVLARAWPKLGQNFESLWRVFGLINPYCLFPIFVIMFGLGETPKIAVLAWVSLWPIFFGAETAFRNVNPQLLKTALSMNCRSWAIFWRITLPASLPAIFTGARIGVEMSFFILIAAEMTGATAGLGWIIHNAGAAYQTERIYGAGVCVVILGVGINRFLELIRQNFLAWGEGDGIPWLLSSRASKQPTNRLVLWLCCLIFALVMALGFWKIFQGENLILSSPNP
ncbi:MAG: ABC transporter permease [Deltaproteobacteria bacterium]|jgi:NitT/TauT family transport system permease protein|nr:ABC transporter permease [Deltaproteobacteria bacterium]